MSARVTWIKVQIITPDLPGRPSRLLEVDSRRPAAAPGQELRALLSAQVQQSLGMRNSFSLTFPGDYDWGDLIPQMSLVFIEMGASDQDESDATMMVGLTGPVSRQVAVAGQSGKLQITQTVSGSGIESVLSTAGVWHAPYLDLSKIARDSILAKVAGAPYIEELTGEIAWARRIWGKGIDPREALVRILLYYLANRTTSILSLQLPEPYRVRDLLLPGTLHPDTLDGYKPPPDLQDRRDPQADAKPLEGDAVPIPDSWTIVDDRLRIVTSGLNPAQGRVLQLMQQVLDPVFHELYVIYREGRAHIIHRTKPFLQQRPEVGRTAFTDEVVSVQGGAVYAWPSQIGMQPVRNAFYVTPGAGAVFDNDSFKALLAPEVCDDPADHSFIGRFGVQPMEVTNPYLVADHNGTNQREVVEVAKRLSRILKAWHDPHPAMEAGKIVMPGNTRLRPGRRLFFESGVLAGREFYIQAVTHTHDAASGSFTSDVSVERGWRYTT